MPKLKRSPEEIKAVKAEMLAQATELLCEEGFQGFSMRKLASRLDIAAKTIYNYYLSKDEIYLAILTQGFEQLYQACLAAQQAQEKPREQIHAILNAYLDFGLENAYLYNLMFTWVVPKYNDYVGTEMEPIARAELETAQKSPILFIATIMAYMGEEKRLSAAEARVILVQIWTQAHGYVAGINNNLLDYMHEDPRSLREDILHSLMAQMDKSATAALM